MIDRARLRLIDRTREKLNEPMARLAVSSANKYSGRCLDPHSFLLHLLDTEEARVRAEGSGKVGKHVAR